MRGKHRHAEHRGIPSRNIPAYAGKTHTAYGLCQRDQEHPRVCGENSATTVWSIMLWGTSPRMRGKLKSSKPMSRHTRNIPAYAGKTYHPRHRQHPEKEHPRVCGENLLSLQPEDRNPGTSPRMRGKHLLTCGSSFLKVILHSILFFCTVGGSMESPLQLPPF